MRKMIDADKLLELFEQDDDMFKSQDIRHIISKTATADVVEVVRCEDCKHWQTSLKYDHNCCDVAWMYTISSDYCSHAERKEK